MITAKETFLPDLQSVRVQLINPLGHVVHDMTLPLVVTVNGEHRAYDVDKAIKEHVDFHTERHRAFIAAAAKRGHVAEKDCGCGA